MTTSRIAPEPWMYLDGNGKVTTDDIIKKSGGWFKVHPNGQEELIHSLKTIGDVAPYIVSITNHADGTYPDSTAFSFTVVFSENVTVNEVGGTPAMIVYTEEGDEYLLDYASGSGTTDLVFTGTPTGIADGNLVVMDEIFNLGGTIKDSVGQDVDVRFPTGYIQPAIVMETV